MAVETRAEKGAIYLKSKMTSHTEEMLEIKKEIGIVTKRKRKRGRNRKRDSERYRDRSIETEIDRERRSSF